MATLPDDLFRRWTHSFEEDTADGVTVYRPAEYDFPPARGRAGIELRADGEFVDWTIGPTDRQEGVHGRWRGEGSGFVSVAFEGGARGRRLIEVLECDAGVLRVRHRRTGS